MTLTLQREDGRSLLKTDLLKDNVDALTQPWAEWIQICNTSQCSKSN